MVISKQTRFWGLGLLGLGCATVLLCTRFGVFLMFDVVGDVRGTDNFMTLAADAPVQITHQLEGPTLVPLPKHIEQVSGIDWQGAQMILSTDQAELFFLSEEGAEIQDGGNLYPITPLLLRQGGLESVAQVGDAYWLVGETGHFVMANAAAEVIGSTPMPTALENADLTGIAWDNGVVYLTRDSGMDVARLDMATGALTRIPLDFSAVSTLPLPDEAFQWSGVAVAADRLYLVAENYPVVVVADVVSGVVIQTLGFDGVQEFSDISVFDGRMILPSDHNLFDPRPPLMIYDLPA